MNLRRHRKPLASLFLGMWLFALFAGLANACLDDEALPASSLSAMATGMAQHDGDHAKPAGCEQFCKIDTPLLTKLQLLEDQPAGQPLLLASVDVRAMPLAARAVSLAGRLHPPPAVPLLLRTLRLAL